MVVLLHTVTGLTAAGRSSLTVVYIIYTHEYLKGFETMSHFAFRLMELTRPTHDLCLCSTVCGYCIGSAKSLSNKA